MWALRKDQRNLTPGQRGTLAQIAVVNKPLYKGYLIKTFREAFEVKSDQGNAALMRGVTAWAHRVRRSPSSPGSASPATRPPSPPPWTAAPPTAAPNAQVNALITRAPGFPERRQLDGHDRLRGGLCPECTLRVNTRPVPEAREPLACQADCPEN